MSRASRKASPNSSRWQFLSGSAWVTAGTVPASQLTFDYLFATAGQKPIRLQTLVNGAVTDQTGTLRIIQVTAAPDPPKPPVTSTTVFHAFRGQYVCCDDTLAIAVNRPTAAQAADPNWKPGPWETFTREPQPDGSWAYKSAHGTYIEAIDGGGGEVVCTRTAVIPEATFMEEPRPNGFAMRTVKGFYLCADYNRPVPDGCELNATRTSAGDYETFSNTMPTPPPPEPGKARTGMVRLAGSHGTQDDQGRHYYGGTTLMWGPWAYRVDPGKLDRNLDTLGPGQLDWIRPLGHVIEPADFWGPRANDLTVAGNVAQSGPTSTIATAGTGSGST